MLWSIFFLVILIRPRSRLCPAQQNHDRAASSVSRAGLTERKHFAALSKPARDLPAQNGLLIFGAQSLSEYDEQAAQPTLERLRHTVGEQRPRFVPAQSVQVERILHRPLS